MLITPVYRQQGRPSARPARARPLAEVTAEQFYINSTIACLVASVGPTFVFINSEDL